MILLPGESPPGHNREGGGDESDGEPKHGKGPGRRAAAWSSNDFRRREETMTREELAASAQGGLWKVLGILLRVEDVLEDLARDFPDSPEAMLKDRQPEDVMLAVEIAIRCAISDDLWPLMERLKRAAGLTPTDLLREWGLRKMGRVN
jgi:hypothetical protein